MVDYFTRGSRRKKETPFAWLPSHLWRQKQGFGPDPRDNFFVPTREVTPLQQSGPPPQEAPVPLQQEVSGEPTSIVPIDQVNRDFAPPTDLVGGSFFSGGDPSRGPAIGSGYRYSHPVHKGAAGGPFSEARALAREDAPWQKFIVPAMTVVGGSQIPGASLLGLLGAGLNKLGAFHQFNPAADSNLFADPETGRATWGTTDPGGSGSQRGTLNLYNMLQDLGGSYPTRQVQTPSRTIWGSISPGPEKGLPIYYDDDSSTVVPQYANARDLAYIMDRGDRPPPGLYTTSPTNLGQQQSGYGDLTNQQAAQSLSTQSGTAWNELAGEIEAAGGGYNDAVAASMEAASDLQNQIDYSDVDWGDWL